MPGSRRFVACCGVLAVVGLLLGGCKVSARVDVTVRADGSGTVTTRVALDAGAVQRLTTHAPLAQAVPLGDLRGAGWGVSAWKPVKSGGDAITFSHGFTGQADLARRLEDLAGPNGVVRDPTITRTRGLFSSKDAISVIVDLRNVTAGVKTDAQLAARLRAAGIDVNTLDAQLTAQLAGALHVEAVVQAPGGETRTISLAAGGHGTVTATQSHTYTRKLVLLAVGAALLVLALLVMAASLRSRSRRSRAS